MKKEDEILDRLAQMRRELRDSIENLRHAMPQPSVVFSDFCGKCQKDTAHKSLLSLNTSGMVMASSARIEVWEVPKLPIKVCLSCGTKYFKEDDNG